jgi:choline dehydrogenase-like flavoprotein
MHFFSFCHGAHTEVDFDFAAGAAGSVIANRLTEDPSISVLLLEAGPSWVVLLPQLNPLVIDHISGLYQKHRCSRQYHSDVPCIAQPQYAIWLELYYRAPGGIQWQKYRLPWVFVLFDQWYAPNGFNSTRSFAGGLYVREWVKHRVQLSAILNLSQTTWPIHEEALKSGIVMRDSVEIPAGHGTIFSNTYWR